MEIKQAETRQDLLSLMAPPEGYQFDQGLGCAYSADSRTLQQLERILGIFYDAGARHAFENGDSFRLYVQQGEYQGQLFNCVRVVAPEAGCLHAKVFCLAYRHPCRPPLVRLIVASANLTNAHELNVYAMAEGPAGNAPVSPVTKRAADWLEQQGFDLPSGDLLSLLRRADLGKNLDFLPVSRELLQQMHQEAAAAVEILLISPFLKASIVNTLLPPGRERHLVSRADALASLDALPAEPETLNFYTLEGSQPQQASSQAEAFQPERALHAKLYAFEQRTNDDAAVVYLGSANATVSAFMQNIEILVRFRQPPGFIQQARKDFAPADGFPFKQEASAEIRAKEEFDHWCRAIVGSFAAEERFCSVKLPVNLPEAFTLRLDGRQPEAVGHFRRWSQNTPQRHIVKLDISYNSFSAQIPLIVEGENVPVDQTALSLQINREIAHTLARAAGQRADSVGTDTAKQRSSGTGDGVSYTIGGVIAGIRNPGAAQKVLDQISQITAQLSDNNPMSGRLSDIQQQILEIWDLSEQSLQEEVQHG